MQSVSEPARAAHRPVLPFLIGTAIGGIAGAVIGSMLSEHMAHLVSGMVGMVDRRSGDNEPPFDLLMQ